MMKRNISNDERAQWMLKAFIDNEIRKLGEKIVVLKDLQEALQHQKAALEKNGFIPSDVFSMKEYVTRSDFPRE